MLNNQYGAAAATIQEYVNRMNVLGVCLVGERTQEKLKLGWNC